MAFTTIAKPSVHFDCPTWTGQDTTTTITGMGFKPDSLWIKNYSGSGHPVFNNSTQGTAKNWIPSGQNTVNTTVYVASYTSDGFTLTGNLENTNDASYSYVGACWKANGGTTASNSDGATTSTVQANTTAGFSIVTYTGTGSATTLGHGLGAVPKTIITKSMDTADYGGYGNGSTLYYTDPWTDNLEVASNGSTWADADTFWNDTAPTSTVFSVKSHNTTNKSGDDYVAYCFTEVQGFSKFGFYTGTGNVRGTKVYCGFRPKWIMIKNAGASENWFTKISGLTGYGLGGERKRTVKYDDSTSSTNCTVNFESNGFRPVTTDGKANGDDVKYIYMAFAEMPVVGTNGTIALAI